ncbi:hypothetical protein KTO58_28335 [Chitinophaga pendula]|uniref:hypothetical protein n=1 Tax=Chitinophaga TaxID=79328 RepID=UPI000BB0836C|nr:MULTISPECIES: hypothetical protein [Chitinophaga]ASZ09543.1 hypothetical protein CK934_00395 [Chitinophaga sp. MD30]UCJ07522.1 hypothetical protein KTO58_28335 [Chitinophaga pendula]
MELELVDNTIREKQFLEVHIAINRHVPGWIRPLDKDILQVFDPATNKFLREGGSCVRWLLKDASGGYIGRIAAFVNPMYKTKGDKWPVGGVGFFDCIDDQAAANLLFDASRRWLEERGMGAMDGPINLGDRERWWGLLVEGFSEPLYGMNFNPPYYQRLLETYGFQPFFHQLCFSMKVRTVLDPRFARRHARIAKDPDYHAEHVKRSNLEKYARDFTTIYNKAWAGHGSNKEMAPEQAIKLFNAMKAVMDEQLTWFVYYKSEPIACWLNLPDLNQYFKHMNGQFGWFEQLRFLWLKMTRTGKKFVGLVFGVVPEFQAKGVDAYMIMEGAKLIQHELSYEDYEMQWIGDFNPKMVNIAERLGAMCSRRLTTYRYQFDRTVPFERHPILS